MSKVNPYPYYSDSDQAWLGKLPSHWQVMRTKLLFNLVTEFAPVGNSEELLSVYTAIGVKPRKELEARGNKASSTDNYWRVQQGDIIVNKLLAWMGAIGISEYNGVTSPAYDILRPKENVNPYYYNFLFRNPIASREFKRHSRGIMDMRLRLYFTRFGDIKLPLPPMEEQDKIVEYLQFKLKKIDRFIRKKKQLIKLLNEQKVAIINNAVTKGLNPEAKMKPSEIEWLGDIPEHWKIKPIKYLLSCNDDALSNKTDKDFKLRYLDIGNVNKEGVISEIVEYRFKDAPSRARRIVKNGDVIISTVRTYLKAITRIQNDTEDLIVSTGFAVLRPNHEIQSDFLNYSIRANYFIERVCSESYGVSYPAINSTDLICLKLAHPDTIEQLQIVDYINQESDKINTTISTIEKEIILTQEYRTALISEAVTGKIDVRDFVIPEEKEEDPDSYRDEDLEEELNIAAEDQAEYEIMEEN